MAIRFSSEARATAFAIIREENLNSNAKIRERFKVTKSTAYTWARMAGVKMNGNYRTLESVEYSRSGEKKPVSEEKKKPRELPFVEPDPGMNSFKSDKEAANYYRLRAEYLESLYMLADSPTDVKKKTLRQLEERVRERMREEQT